MKIAKMRNAIVGEIKKKFPELRDVKTHPGRLTGDDVKRLASKLPAARVAVIGMPQISCLQEDRIEYSVKFAIFIMTKDAGALSRGEAALNIVEVLAGVVQLNAWGQISCGLPGALKMENLYTGNVGRIGVALLALTWTQTITVGAPDEAWVVPTQCYSTDESENFGKIEHYVKLGPEK